MKRYILPYLCLVALFFFAACSSDEENPKPEGEMTHISMTISTRATGTPETATVNEELIHTWWVVFVNKLGNVQKIISRPSSSTTYVEEERVDLDIPVGTYTLYAFANIDPSAKSVNTVTIADLTFTEGSSCPTDIAAKTYSLTNGWTGSIPMTGTQNVTVTGRANETFSIEVVRMLAKMEFQYKNQSAVGLSINSLSIKQVQETSVPLLPNYTYLNNGWTFENLTTSTAFIPGPFTRSYSSPISVAAYSGNGDPASQTDKFYMIESQADYNTPTQSYLMTLNVTRNGEANNLYFSLDNTKIQTIYRNDHVIVPLVISDYIVGLDVIFYPPIGGYPAVITEDKDKDEFYCTFATQGEFEIKPTVYNASTKTNVYYPNWDYDFTIVDGVKTYNNIVVSDPSNIFSTSPHIDTTTGELLGKLSTATGTASIDVKIKVKTSSDPVVYRDYTRRIYIIRKNAS